MSERGSFVTEYTYCNQCFEVLKKSLLEKNKGLCSFVVPAYTGGELPIIAGKLGGMYSGEEVHMMETIIEDRMGALCHPVRIAVIPEGGDAKILEAGPKTEPD